MRVTRVMCVVVSTGHEPHARAHHRAHAPWRPPQGLEVLKFSVMAGDALEMAGDWDMPSLKVRLGVRLELASIPMRKHVRWQQRPIHV